MLPPAALDKHFRFYRDIRYCYTMTQERLVDIVRNKQLSPMFRAAALRNVVCNADITITKGRTWGHRRRLVRQHFNI
ncbi:hypothetical protein Rfer_4304 (plasmid) [Rhodoferax ferrireducens T118]|uniref:Uncharacterized protein n=1 Tax=Albidiferax ferrireducens (strain ATCC BAA-621 / DSM 15236 / T118) TaxID=338969 RepID=Q21QF5_ALBFT|nr:hypothetical protein [Rhodoferax ferrireducens]ABD71990.1 hypothetical protein Rfer_4304 [Rhodoferax ferrireducens T118]